MMRRPRPKGDRISPRRHEVAFTFIAPRGFSHPKTRAHVRLLGPCFKTGRMDPYDRQRPKAYPAAAEKRIEWRKIYSVKAIEPWPVRVSCSMIPARHRMSLGGSFSLNFKGRGKPTGRAEQHQGWLAHDRSSRPRPSTPHEPVHGGRVPAPSATDGDQADARTRIRTMGV